MHILHLKKKFIYLFIHSFLTALDLCCCTWHVALPGPGIEPVSPALAGGFLTTGPPGKSSHTVLKVHFDIVFLVYNWKEFIFSVHLEEANVRGSV